MIFKKNIILIKKKKISYILKKKSRLKKSVVFLSGYRSDKRGTKANFIESLCTENGFEYLRFDYSGHGDSSGNINNLVLSDWINESKIIIEKKTNYPLILIGSSMCGWIAFYLSLILNKKIIGIIGIASAIDFTLKLVKNLNSIEYKNYDKKKEIKVYSKYSRNPYTFKKSFIDDSKKFLLLNKKINIKVKATLLYGLKDSSVHLDSQIEFLKNLTHPETSLIISKNSDHRMSSNYDLKVLKDEILKFL